MGALDSEWNPSDPHKDKQLKEALAHCTAIFKVRAGWCDTCCCKKGLVDYSIHSEVVSHDDSHGHHAWIFDNYCENDKIIPNVPGSGDCRDNLGRKTSKCVDLSRPFTVFQNFRQTWGGCGGWFQVVDQMVRAIAALTRTGIYNLRYGNGARGLRCVDPKCIQCTA